jgi:hypothetical protein
MIGSAILVIFLIYIPRDMKFYLCYVLFFSIFCLVFSAGTNDDHKKEMKCTCLLMFLVRDSYSSAAPTSSIVASACTTNFDLGIRFLGELELILT